MNNTNNTQSNKNIKEEQKMENKALKARFLANGDLSIELIHDGEKITVKIPHQKFVGPTARQNICRTGYLDNKWTYINCFTGKEAIDNRTILSYGQGVYLYELLPNNKVMAILLVFENVHTSATGTELQPFVNRIYVFGNNHVVRYTGLRYLETGSGTVENISLMKDLKSNSYSYYSGYGLHLPSQRQEIMNAIYHHLGQDSNTAYRNEDNPYYLEQNYIRYLRSRSGVMVTDNPTVDTLYTSMLNRPVVLPSEEQRKQAKDSNLIAAIGERLKDTIMVTCQLSTYYNTVTRIIINKKHFSVFSANLPGAEGNRRWSNDNWHYECAPDQYSLKKITIVNLTEEMVKGLPYEKVVRAHYFQDMVREHVSLFRIMRKGTIAKEYAEAVKHLIWACDSKECRDLFVSPNGKSTFCLFGTYGRSLTMVDMLHELFYSNISLGTNLNSTIGLNHEQLKMLVELEMNYRKTESPTDFNRGYTHYRMVRSVLSSYRSFVFVRTNTDLRPTSNADFRTWIDWAIERNERGDKGALNFGYGCERLLPANIDRMALARFWKNHNYGSADIESLYDLISMNYRMTQVAPTLEDFRIRDVEDLRRRHDRAVVAQKMLANKTKMEKWEAVKPNWDKYKFKDEDFEIVPPKEPDEIVAEGRILNHCVGGYVDRVANGETIILFLRKKSEPDKPFYTLNLDPTGKRLIQVHGYKNRWPATDPETLPFLDEWVKKFGFEGWDYIRTVNRDHY